MDNLERVTNVRGQDEEGLTAGPAHETGAQGAEVLFEGAGMYQLCAFGLFILKPLPFKQWGRRQGRKVVMHGLLRWGRTA